MADHRTNPDPTRTDRVTVHSPTNGRAWLSIDADHAAPRPDTQTIELVGENEGEWIICAAADAIDAAEVA